MTVPAYEILLATCNGAAFLEAQLTSLAGQTWPPLRVLVADDGSEDGTLRQLQAWQRRADLPLEVLASCSGERLGVCANFERLLVASRAPYVLLADQDDVWDRDKAERLLVAMEALEQRVGVHTPLLVHANLRLIGADGCDLGKLFHQAQHLNPWRNHWLELALQNTVTGCACVVNRACLQVALPFPAEVVLHDGWLALVAARTGAIGYLPQACMGYRQHGTNAVGAAGWRQQWRRRYRQLVAAPERAALAELWIGGTLRQLRACERRFAPGDHRGRPRAQAMAALFSTSPWQRLAAALRLRLHKHGLRRTLGFYLALWWWRPQCER